MTQAIDFLPSGVALGEIPVVVERVVVTVQVGTKVRDATVPCLVYVEIHTFLAL